LPTWAKSGFIRGLTVTLTNKKELARLETVPGAIRTSETGWREEDVRRSMTVRDYWVQA